MWLAEDLAIVGDTLQKGSVTLIASLNDRGGLLWIEAVTAIIHCTLLSVGNVTLTFLLRLAILLQALPLFAFTITVDFIGRLVKRDLRRFGAGHKSGFIYHHTRCMIAPSLAATGLVWLTVSIFPVPEYMFIPTVAEVGLAVSMAGESFKKYV